MVLRGHISDLIHAIVVLSVCIMATLYAVVANDHSDNVWIVYGSAIAFAAGRAGAAISQRMQGGTREEDPQHGA